MGACLPTSKRDRSRVATNLYEEQIQQDEDILDHNAAVDYALNKSKQRQNYTVLELIISARNIPRLNLLDKPNTFATMGIDMEALDHHDRKHVEEEGAELLKAKEALLEKEKTRLLKKSGKINAKLEDEEVQIAQDGRKWMIKLKTECVWEDVNPIFQSSMTFNIFNYEAIKLRVDLYQSKSNLPIITKTNATYLGTQYFTVLELFQSGGLLTKPLENTINPKLQKKLNQKKTSVTMRYEKIEQTNTVVQLQFQAKGFDHKYIFYKLFRSRDMGEFVPFYTSPRIRNDRVTGSKWERTDFPMKEICRNDNDRTLKLKVFEWKRIKGIPMFMFVGEFEFTMKTMADSLGKYTPCYDGKLLTGKIKLCFYNLYYKFQFIDYIHGGLDISLVCAMDFSLCNGRFDDPESLHYLPKKDTGKDKSSQGASSSRINSEQQKYVGVTTRVEQVMKAARGVNIDKEDVNYKIKPLNEFQEALFLTMNIMEPYDDDKQIPFIGFGAKVPPFFNIASSCFAVNGNIFMPECHGIQGLMDCYERNARNIQQHGPSAHSQAIRFAMQFSANKVSQEDQFFTILVIFSKGEVSDYQSTVNAIVEASKLPMSIIIVGVGPNADKANGTKLDGDDGNLVNSETGEECKRDIVQYVQFREYMNDFKALAREVLAELAKQIKDFFLERKIWPNAQKKQAKGNLLKKEAILRPMESDFGAITTVYQNIILRKLQDEIADRMCSLGFNRFDVELLLKRGMYSEDISLAVDQLSSMHQNTFEKRKADKERAERLEAAKKALKEKQLADLKRFGDVRDQFTHWEVPLLAPSGFKPLEQHRKLCKICYSEKIDSILVPCKHKLFCWQCRDFLEQICPLCGAKIEEVVKLYKLKKFSQSVAQL